jgi:hypothetical protein
MVESSATLVTLVCKQWGPSPGWLQKWGPASRMSLPAAFILAKNVLLERNGLFNPLLNLPVERWPSG